MYRGSTTLFPNAAAVHNGWRQEDGYTYGLRGTPTTRELAVRLAELEGGLRTFITPGGQAAIALIDFAFLAAGDHVLIPDSAYGPHRQLADDVLRRFGVDVTYYPPLAGADIEQFVRPNTRLVWCESPGSVTMQALTKYVGGHSDLLLGSVTVRTEAAYERVGVAEPGGPRGRPRPGAPPRAAASAPAPCRASSTSPCDGEPGATGAPPRLLRAALRRGGRRAGGGGAARELSRNAVRFRVGRRGGSVRFGF